MSDIQKELVEIEQKCAEAFNRKDVDTILQYFSDQISGFSSTRHERFSGKEELRQTFEYYLGEAEEVSYRFTEPQTAVFGDIAILSFYWTVTLKNDGKVTEIAGRGTHVFQKSDGEWKIVHEHFSKAH